MVRMPIRPRRVPPAGGIASFLALAILILPCLVSCAPAGAGGGRTVRIVVLGHDGCGKSTLTSAITRILSRSGDTRFVQYEDLANPGSLRIAGMRIAGTSVKCRTGSTRYTLLDFRDAGECRKFLQSPAGVVDGAIVVVSAVDGPMPQTREQVQLAHDAGIPSVLVFINKIDLLQDAELLELVKLETREILSLAGYAGEKVPFLRGSALMALVGTEPSIGSEAVLGLLGAMDSTFAAVRGSR